VADEAAYAETKRELSAQLLKTLRDAGDPRVTGDGETFERSPFTDAVPPAPVRKRRP
jgi:hypothetical protein